MNHPGKILKELLKSKSLTQRQFAILLGKKVSELNELINGKRNITVQWDILLSHFLGTETKYWLNLQNDYDYKIAQESFDKDLFEKNKLEHEASQNLDKKPIEIASDSDQKINKEEKNIQELSNPKIQLNKPDINLPSKSKNQIPIKKPEKIIDSGYKNNKYDKQKIYNEDDIFDSYFPPKDKKEKKEKHVLKSINVDKKLNNKISDFDSKKNPPVPHQYWCETTPPLKKEDKKLEGQEKKDDHKDHHKHKENVFRNF